MTSHAPVVSKAPGRITRRRNRKWTDAEIAEIVRRRLVGESWARIASDLGLRRASHPYALLVYRIGRMGLTSDELRTVFPGVGNRIADAERYMSGVLPAPTGVVGIVLPARSVGDFRWWRRERIVP